MEKVDKLLEQANEILNEKLEQLEVLEEEKKKIVLLYEKVDLNKRVLIEKEMKKSIDRYKKLCDEVLMLSVKIKKLKKEYC